MKKLTILLLVLLFSSVQAEAQRIGISRFWLDNSDLTALNTTTRKENIDGDYCGLIRVRCADSGVSFESKYIIEVEQSANEYLVWMNPHAPYLIIKVPGYLPFKVDFKEQGFEDGIMSKATYVMVIEDPKHTTMQSSVSYTVSVEKCYNEGNEYYKKKDYAGAKVMYEKAAELGYAPAKSALGYMYEKGYGVTQDYSKAAELYQEAANQGNEKAKSYLDLVKTAMASKNKTLAQTTSSSTQKPSEKPKEQPITQLQPKAQPQSQTKVGIDQVDTGIPVISRVNRNTFAIIIANEDYQKESKVDYAKNDGQVFCDYCYKTLGLPEKNVHFVPNATLNNLIGELDWLQQVCKAYKGEASIIFYYAGHGIPDEVSGSSYLLPTDGNSRILRTCFSIDELYKTLGSMTAKKVTVLMDACFSGAKRSGGMLASARGVAIKAKSGEPDGNMIVLSAAQGDETAYKYDEAKHGLFTYFLLKKLKDSKGSVTMGELSNYIQDQVGRYSIVENGKSQTPSILTSQTLRNNWKEQTFY